tara:strand:- start:52026 stop:52868 length:843 start_codon:yes stop_codon:yes gene_type:complete
VKRIYRKVIVGDLKPDTFLLLKGDGLSPESVPLDVLTKLLEAFRSLYRGLPADPQTGDPFYVSLVEIKSGSSGYGFAFHDPDLGKRRTALLTTAIREKDATALPPELIKPAKTFFRTVQKDLGYRVEWYMAGQKSPEVSLDPTDMVAFPESGRVRGHTTIRCKVIKAGGVRSTVSISIPGHSRPLTCQITRELAEEFGQNLYRTVDVQGIGEWTTDTIELVSFVPDAFSQVPDSDFHKALKTLRSIHTKEMKRMANTNGLTLLETTSRIRSGLPIDEKEA